MDKTKKKRIKRYITWGCMALVVILLTVMPLLAKREAEKDGPQASLLTATVEQGSITTALHGGGTLEDEGAEDVIIPTGVKITEFLVKNGDVVKAGTPVAAVIRPPLWRPSPPSMRPWISSGMSWRTGAMRR